MKREIGKTKMESGNAKTGWHPHIRLKPCKGVATVSESLANIVVHLVFSTKGRRPLLRDEERKQLHAYITGILNNLDSPLIEINSVRDHVHILFVQSKTTRPRRPSSRSRVPRRAGSRNNTRGIPISPGRRAVSVCSSLTGRERVGWTLTRGSALRAPPRAITGRAFSPKNCS